MHTMFEQAPVSGLAITCIRDRRVRRTEEEHSISQFQSFCTALAATLGTGNITGVAAALIAGGPGAIFWMWVSAFLGMMTIYAENLLGIRYRYKNRKGEWVGGAMVYIERGLGCKWLAVLFAVFCIFASFGMGNMTQANSMASGLKESLSIPPFITGAVVTLVVAAVILGGVKRIAAVTEKVVPFVALFYMAGGMLVLIHFRAEVPGAVRMIFEEAFRMKAVGGGVIGYGIRQAMKIGISRGVFSNEAGLGSSVMAHAASDVKSPAIQGMCAFFRTLMSLSREYQAALLGIDPQDSHAAAERWETARLTLEPLRREDLPPVYSLTSDPEVTRYLRSDTHTDPMEALVLIDELTSGGNYGYLVTSKEEGYFIGVFALKADEKDPTSANLTVFLSRSFWNRGYAGELLAFAKKKAPELSFKTLRAWVADGNAGSRRALEKAGFTVEQRLTFRGIDGGLTTYVFPLKPEKA